MYFDTLDGGEDLLQKGTSPLSISAGPFGPLKNAQMGVVAFWGQRSLEIYLLQYHVWLSSNAARILVVLPGRPVMNACVVFAGFLAAADVAHRCTSGVAGVLLAQKFQLILS